MKTLRQFAAFTGSPAPVGFRAVGDRLKLNVWDQFHSARRTIEFFEALATIPVDFQLDVTPATSGTATFKVTLRISLPNNGFGQHFMGVRFRVLQQNQPIAVYDTPGVALVFHTFTTPGQYLAEATIRAIGVNGYAEVTKTVPIAVHAQPAPPPPPPKPPPEPPRAKPDLAFTGPATFNTSTKRVEITFRNKGTKAAGAFRVGGQINNESIGEIPYTSMPAGQGDTVSFDPGFLPAGDYTYNFVLDLYSTVNESNENNNGFNGFFSIPS